MQALSYYIERFCPYKNKNVPVEIVYDTQGPTEHCVFAPHCASEDSPCQNPFLQRKAPK